MPESLAPGVFVEETSFRSKPIEGVGTTTTGFVGPTRYGPVGEPPELLTSLGDFERIHGGSARLQFRDAVGAGTGESDNFLWHAARAFFAEGGRRLHVARVFRPLPNSQGGEPSYPPNFTDPGYCPFNLGSAEAPLWNDGHGRGQIGSLLKFRSRFPGQAGNRIVRLQVRAGNNVLRAAKDPARSTPSHPVYRPKRGALTHGDIVWIERSDGHPTAGYYRAEQDPVSRIWRFVGGPGSPRSGSTVEELGLVAGTRRGRGDAIRVLTVTVQVLSEDREHDLATWRNLPLDPVHERNGSPDSVFARFEGGASATGDDRALPLVLDFEQSLNKSQQEVLNPEGINCFRSFEGRGFRLWGARTISSDPEWKYVHLRRYFCYLERSIDRGTPWVVFEPNGETLWANIRRTIEDFLLKEWQSGALLGDKPEKAFFVRCDRSTMTQNDLDHGRLICLIGVAPPRPAEFLIFRIGQWTADRKG